MKKGAIFGFGSVGQSMTKNLNEQNEEFRITAACDLDTKKQSDAVENFGLKAVANLDELLDDLPDFLLITSTSHVHPLAAKWCFKNKVPFLIEKPIAIDYKSANELAELCKNENLLNVVNYSMRFSPVSTKIKEMVESGTLGNLLSICLSSYRGYGFYQNGKRHPAIISPETSGGWIIHHLTHILDFAIWLAGDVEEVHAYTRTTAPEELKSEEVICSLIKFKNGVIGTINDQIGIVRDHTMQIVGDKGGVIETSKDGLSKIKFSDEAGAYRNATLIDPDPTNELKSGLHHFFDCLSNNKPSQMPMAASGYVTTVCEAMKMSAYENRIVKIDELLH
ncbi:MAG: hypothetical protein COA79_05585 [Planctomycetota bacterium]|nr:MAG: hypothetical protein COA79_05585 [Planctomycetota bacterium]